MYSEEYTAPCGGPVDTQATENAVPLACCCVTRDMFAPRVSIHTYLELVPPSSSLFAFAFCRSSCMFASCGPKKPLNRCPLLQSHGGTCRHASGLLPFLPRSAKADLAPNIVSRLGLILQKRLPFHSLAAEML